MQPTEVGVDATVRAARGMGAFYDEVAGATERAGQAQARAGEATGKAFGTGIADAGKAATDYQTHRQISQGAAVYAKTLNDATQAWNAIAKDADPNDSTVAENFRNELEPRIQKFVDGFTTDQSREWAERQAAALRSHMFEKTAADMSNKAGEAAVVNHRQTFNELSNTALTDFTSRDHALQTLESSTRAMVESIPTLTPGKASQLTTTLLQEGREKILRSAAFGQIQATGVVPEWTSDPKYAPYFDIAELKQFATTARYYQRMAQGEERAQRVQRDYDAKNQFNSEINKLEAETMPQKPGDPPTVPADAYDRLRKLSVTQGAALEPGRLAATVTKLEAITARLDKPEPLARVSHDTTVGLLQRMRATDETRLQDNTEFYKAFERGELSNADLNFLNREWTASRTPEGERLSERKAAFINGVRSQITKSNPIMGTIDKDGDPNMYRLEWELNRRIETYRRAGKDPYDLLDPSKPDFMGSAAALDPFRKPLNQSTRDSAKRMGSNPAYVPLGAASDSATPAAPSVTPTAPARPALPPKNAGETPEQYLKRIGAH